MGPRAVWTLAGGKGGTGRTLLAANLGIQLARAGRAVVLIDLDLQGPGLHTALGFARVRRGLSALPAEGPAALADLTVETPINHLRLIGGLPGACPPEAAEALVRRIGEGLQGLDTELVIIDCGGGRSGAPLAAFGLGSLGLLVSTPEPQALEATCLFVEAHLRRCLEKALPADTRHALDELLAADGIAAGRLTFRSLMVRLASIDRGARDAVEAVIRATRLELLLNQVRDEADEEAGAALASACRKVFGVEMPIAGLVEHDPSVLQAIHKRRPLSQQFPNTPATRGIGHAARQLIAASEPDRPAPAMEWEELAALDHYRVLEIVPKASSREIQSAYQVMKRAYDPEATPLAALLDIEALRAIQARVEEAYRTVIFLESRVAYDRGLLEAGRLGPNEIRGLHAAMAAPGPAPAAGSDGMGAPTPAPPPGEAPPAAPDGAPSASSPQVPGDTGSGAPAAMAASGGPASEDQASSASTGPRSPAASGAALREERLRQGRTLEVIASRTKIRQTYLQAIEEERFDALPPPVFLRGFVREFAACLGLPADESARAILARRERALQPAADAAGGADRRSA
jgi:flagellar biosynthesis protein FlhG